MNKVAEHERVLGIVRTMLYDHGAKSTSAQSMTRSKFDLLVDGRVRVEIKTAVTLQRVKGTPCWRFNIHRHGKKSPAGAVDWFVLFIPPITVFDFRKGIYLIVPAFIVEKKFTILVSPRSLLTYWGQFANKWHHIIQFSATQPNQ